MKEREIRLPRSCHPRRLASFAVILFCERRNNNQGLASFRPHMSLSHWRPRLPISFSYRGYGLSVHTLLKDIGAGIPEPGQMGGSRAIWHANAYAWPRALHSRFACAQALRAGELSRGVGLRGFESHSPHHMMHYPVSQAFSELATFGVWMQKQII